MAAPTYVNQWLQGYPTPRGKEMLRPLLNAYADRLSCVATSTAGLVITATAGKYVPKIGAVPFAGFVKGVPVAIAAGTDMPSLGATNTFTTGQYRIYCFFIDAASAVTSAAGTAGATLALATFPPFPEGKTLVGYIVVTYAGTFTPDTTALDTATTVYVSPVGALDPNVLITN